MRKPLPDQDTLRELLDYNALTGILTWRPRDESYFQSRRSFKYWNKRYANKPALTLKTKGGYFWGRVLGEKYSAARIIWVWVHGDEPDQIDHINGDPGDNRLENLRSVSPTENCRNRSRISNNKSGVTGVIWRNRAQVWYAYITNNGKQETIGFFKTKGEAVEARQRAAADLGYHENHGRVSHV